MNMNEQQFLDHVDARSLAPWANMTEEERRAAYGGFLYPAWYPFAVCEGNFNYKDPYFDHSWKKAPKKIHKEVDEEVEARKKQFAVPMATRAAYTPHSPVAALKRAA